MLICNLQGRATPVVQNHPLGIEVEYERAYTAPDNIVGWTMHHDGSLRDGGVEYVFTQPTHTNKGIENKLRRLSRIANKLKWGTSVRTGVHVHVNMQGIEHDALRNVLLAYALAEPALYSYAGSSRHENPYCVPWYYAPQDAVLSMKAIHYMHSGDTRNAVTTLMRTNKYSGLYLRPLTTFGTIEFRHLPTTLDADRLVEWAMIVRQVVDYGLNNNLAARTQQEEAEDLAFEMLRSIQPLRQHVEVYEKVDVSAVFTKMLPWYVSTVSDKAWLMLNDRPRKKRDKRKRKPKYALDPENEWLEEPPDLDHLEEAGLRPVEEDIVEAAHRYFARRAEVRPIETMTTGTIFTHPTTGATVQWYRTDEEVR